MSEKEASAMWLLVVAAISVGILDRRLIMMGYGWGLMFLIPIFFLVLIALGAYFLIKAFGGAGRPTSSRRERSLEILKERYARGEITEEQYMRMKEELESWF